LKDDDEVTIEKIVEEFWDTFGEDVEDVEDVVEA